MAIKKKLPPLKEENMEEKEESEAPPEGESALFGLTDPALKELIRSASEYGYVTYDQIDCPAVFG
jgi:hypothetical protein